MRDAGLADLDAQWCRSDAWGAGAAPELTSGARGVGATGIRKFARARRAIAMRLGRNSVA